MEIVEIIVAAAIPLTIIAVFLNRQHNKKGFGVRSIQFTAASLLISSVVLLSLTDFLSPSTTATLFGALVGYLFGNISNYDEKKDKQ